MQGMKTLQDGKFLTNNPPQVMEESDQKGGLLIKYLCKKDADSISRHVDQ